MKKIFLISLFLLINSLNLLASDKRFSGKKLPRFASIKSLSINSRFGPSQTYPVKYIYNSKSQPVQIINEYYNWYQIKDVYGDTSWIYVNYIGKNDYATSIYDDTIIYAKAKPTSEIVAKVDKGVVFKIKGCKTFCKVETKFKGITFKGFIEKSDLWGVE